MSWLKSLTSKLTRSKSLPVTEDQIRRHREQRRQRDEWKSDVDALQSIIDRLRTEYARHKGDLNAVGRYEELKTMVKLAVEQLSAIVSANKDHRLTGTHRAGTGTALKDEAADFARIQERVKTEEKFYAGMSPGQLDEETDRFRKEVLQLKQDFRVVRERLDELAAAYEKSKQLNPAQRYAALKDMIKDVIVVQSGSSSQSASAVAR